MGLAALNELRDFKGGGGGGGGVWSQKKEGKCEKVSFFYNSIHMFGTIPPLEIP